MRMVLARTLAATIWPICFTAVEACLVNEIVHKGGELVNPAACKACVLAQGTILSNRVPLLANVAAIPAFTAVEADQVVAYWRGREV